MRVVEGSGGMAMSIGRTTGHRLRGLDRLVAAAADVMARPAAHRLPASKVPSRWLIERGPTRASAVVDVIGGFPGSIRSANLLTRTTVVTTDRYLVVGEGTATGFAIRLQDVIGAGLVRSAAQTTPALVIRYRDGDTAGSGCGSEACHARSPARGARRRSCGRSPPGRCR
jgi:hypothetical protein